MLYEKSQQLKVNTLSKVFDKVLNKPQDYLSCFAMILRGYTGTFDTCQTESSIHYNHLIWCFGSFFHFPNSNVPDNKCHKQKRHMLFFRCIKVVTIVLACVYAIACLKWRRLGITVILFLDCSVKNKMTKCPKNLTKCPILGPLWFKCKQNCTF